MISKLGSGTLAIEPQDFQDVSENITLAVANYSLSPKERFFQLPDISSSERVRGLAYNLLFTAHETVKVKLREMRKAIADDEKSKR